MNKQKIPSKWALRLAELHNLVMELQDYFDGIKSDLYCGGDLEEVGLDDYDINDLTEEVEHICDTLEDLEADTSELDCEYNNYD